jgi:hypothetical protein
MVLLSEYKRKRDADTKKANSKTLGNNEATSEIGDVQTAYLTAENLGVKVTILTDTGSDYSAIPHSSVEGARKRGSRLKVEVLPKLIMLNMDIRGESDKQTCSATEMLMSAMTVTTPSDPLCMRGVRQIIVEEDMDHPLIGNPGLGRDGFRGKSASGLCTGQISPARLQQHWRGAIGDRQAAFGHPVKASTHARSHFRV